MRARFQNSEVAFGARFLQKSFLFPKGGFKIPRDRDLCLRGLIPPAPSNHIFVNEEITIVKNLMRFYGLGLYNKGNTFSWKMIREKV